jgi:tetratricopeptide (TPR) repeat protein
MNTPPPQWSRPNITVHVPGTPTDALDTLHLNAYLDYAVGNFAEAAKFLKSAIQAKPSEAAYHFDLGVVNWERGEFAEAHAAFARAAAIDPAFADAFYNAGIAAVRIGQRDQARRHFRAARTSDFSLVVQSAADFVAGLAGKARKPLERYAWRIPTKDFPAVLDAIGFGLMQRGEYERAAAKIRQALALEQTAKRHAALGTILKNMNNLAEAQREFDTALRLEQAVSANTHNKP